MNSGAEERRKTVVDLIELRKPINDAIATLRQYPWDYEEELANLGPAELRHALEFYLSGGLSSDELESWANAVEGRDDISFQSSEIIDLLSELANPLLFCPITHESVSNILKRLRVIEQ